MTVPPHIKSADGESKEQTAQRQHTQGSRVGHGALIFLSIAVCLVTWQFRAIRQAWNDYRDGRNMRIQTTQTQDPGTGDNRLGKAKNETKDQESLPETPVAAPESPEAGKPPQYRRENPLENTRWLGPRPVVGSWAHQGGEWPWRIEQVMYRDIWDNARGTSVLEVKDIFAFYSNTVPQHYESFPPLEEGREADFCGLDVEEGDEMMEWLGE